MRVLVVEDTEDSRLILEDFLVANGYEVDSAVNGVDALEKARHQRPDIIVSDILMPEMDGFELCRVVKKDRVLKSIPFVFYTATYTDSRDEKLALSLGASRFVIKPTDPDVLIDVIEEVLKKYHGSGVPSADKNVSSIFIEKMHKDALNRKLSKKIRELAQKEEELKLASLVYQSSSEGMMVTDENNKIVAVNPAFTAITGYALADVIGKNPRVLKSGRHDQKFYLDMWETLLNTGIWQGEIWDKRKNGEIYPKWLTLNTIRNNAGKVHRYVGIFSDITGKKQTDEIIWRQANFDTLTGLPNRSMFRSSLEQELKKSKRVHVPLALLLIDLDLFKEVNDTLGHDVGDSLLQEAAHRIRECVRESDLIARLGGDEFAVVLTELTESSHIDDIADKISRHLAEPYRIGQEVVYVSGSTGITLYPDDAEDMETLLKNADQAMYVSKRKGRNCFSYFTLSLQEAAQARLRLTNDLRNAMAANQLMLYIQPIVDLSTGCICKAETLLRWKHPERGMVAPMDFIPLAEDTGLIKEMGDWVFKESARLAKRWNDKLGCEYQVSVNMSPLQFRIEDKIFVVEWLKYLKELGLSEKNITVEITEGLLLNAESSVINNILALRDAGIQVAIDDFGTGYSSLSYLKKFDIDYLKIDRTFIHNLENDKNDLALAEAIIVMAHTLELQVIAEGVETEGQAKILADAGCDFAQGYLYATPMPADEFENLLQKKKLTTEVKNEGVPRKDKKRQGDS